MKRIRFAIGALALALVVMAQDPTTTTNAAASAPPAASAPIPGLIAKELPRHDRIDEVAGALTTRLWDKKEDINPVLSLLSDWNLRPKIYQSTGADGDHPGIGLEFEYKKALASHVINPTARNPAGLSLTIEARGDLAVNAEENPNDLIEAGASFNLFQGIGGIDPTYKPSREAQKALQDQITAAARGDETARKLAVKEFTSHMRPQFFYDVSGHGKIETDQKFKDRQYVFGGAVALVFRDWRQSSDVGYFNILDYPFAAIRSFANNEPFAPSGRTFPSLVVGVDQIDPSDNDARLAIDPSDDLFTRLRIEAAFKTPFMQWKDDTLFFRATYRHFQELDPSTAIRAAKLHRSQFFVAVLDLPLNFNVSYSTGKLPLDQTNDNVYAVGWTLNF